MYGTFYTTLVGKAEDVCNSKIQSNVKLKRYHNETDKVQAKSEVIININGSEKDLIGCESRKNIDVL